MFELIARAKINIGLRIDGLRPDGYHEIWSVMQEIGLTDSLRLHDAPDSLLSMACDQPDLPADESNLCLKAARLLAQETGCRRGVHLDLVKRIPVGAGLGGGSSDAAAVLTGLNRFWNLKLDQQALLDLAARLGSDVPFFILGGCCLATGRGEILRRIEPLVHGSLVLIAPNVHVSTAWAYKTIENYPLTSREDYIKFQGSLTGNLPQSQFKAVFKNDFEAPVFAYYPDLGRLKERLLESGAWYASLSGSGSAVFGLFQEEGGARKSQEQMAEWGRTYLIHL